MPVRPHRARRTWLAAIGGLAFLAGQASGATTVGQNFAPYDNCGSDVTLLQTESPEARYTIPKAGVLTSWTISGPAALSPTTPQLTAAFKVVRQISASEFLWVGGSANHTANPGSSFTGNLTAPVQNGDIIGLYVTSGPSCAYYVSGYSYRARSGEHLSGKAMYTPGTNHQLNVSAVLEDDIDGDGKGDDSQDTDDDGDGVADTDDNCPRVANPDQANTDALNDGGDACDGDRDSDGAPDAGDNCPTTANADQANTDGAADGGDACDDDDDNDGVIDTDETARGSDPHRADGDGDGVGDKTDNCVAAANAGQEDFDLDGKGDACDPPLPGVCTNARTGTELADVIAGTIGGDRISALGGKDKVDGRAGADCIDGGGEDDRLTGGDGDDTLKGRGGADRLSGGSGNDTLTGGPDSDRIKGGAGKNRYSGGDGNDTINAVNGNREKVNCGAGTQDRAVVDKSDTVRGCERVIRRP